MNSSLASLERRFKALDERIIIAQEYYRTKKTRLRIQEDIRARPSTAPERVRPKSWQRTRTIPSSHFHIDAPISPAVEVTRAQCDTRPEQKVTLLKAEIQKTLDVEFSRRLSKLEERVGEDASHTGLDDLELPVLFFRGQQSKVFGRKQSSANKLGSIIRSRMLHSARSSTPQEQDHTSRSCSQVDCIPPQLPSPAHVVPSFRSIRLCSSSLPLNPTLEETQVLDPKTQDHRDTSTQDLIPESNISPPPRMSKAEEGKDEEDEDMVQISDRSVRHTTSPDEITEEQPQEAVNENVVGIDETAVGDEKPSQRTALSEKDTAESAEEREKSKHPEFYFLSVRIDHSGSLAAWRFVAYVTHITHPERHVRIYRNLRVNDEGSLIFGARSGVTLSPADDFGWQLPMLSAGIRIEVFSTKPVRARVVDSTIVFGGRNGRALYGGDAGSVIIGSATFVDQGSPLPLPDTIIAQELEAEAEAEAATIPHMEANGNGNGNGVTTHKNCWTWTADETLAQTQQHAHGHGPGALGSMSMSLKQRSSEVCRSVTSIHSEGVMEAVGDSAVAGIQAVSIKARRKGFVDKSVCDEERKDAKDGGEKCTALKEMLESMRRTMEHDLQEKQHSAEEDVKQWRREMGEVLPLADEGKVGGKRGATAAAPAPALETRPAPRNLAYYVPRPSTAPTTTTHGYARTRTPDLNQRPSAPSTTSPSKPYVRPKAQTPKSQAPAFVATRVATKVTTHPLQMQKIALPKPKPMEVEATATPTRQSLLASSSEALVRSNSLVDGWRTA